MNSSTAVVAEELRVVEEGLTLVRMQGQLTDHRADHRAGRLGAAVEDEDRLVQDLLGAPALG